MKAPLSPRHAPGDATPPTHSQPAWKNNAAYDLLRQVKRRTSARLHSARLSWRVRNGFRLVPERAFEDCLAAAIGHLRAEDPGEPRGDYLEFGVCHGASMACMHRVSRKLDLTGLRLIGFDSFEGLPEEAAAPEEGPWMPGQYRCTLSFARRFLDRAGVDWQRTFLVKGWFRDSLTAETRRRYGIERASLIMVDCDICASAREALAFVAPLIRERAVILFDDWHSSGLAEQGRGERLAFEEFLARHPDIEASPLPAYSENSEVFLLRRRELQSALPLDRDLI